MKYLYFLFSIIILSSCGKKLQQPDKKLDNTLVGKPEEHYIDSTNIGISGMYKVDFKKFRSDDSIYVEVILYHRDKSNWKLTQKLHFIKDGILSCDVEIKDFNNDGLRDLTFVSSIAARGANEIRKLLIFDKDTGKFRDIKNAEDFPNLRYNETLNCIDAFRVYGGTQSVFAKIVGDSLREFASIELFDNRITIKTVEADGSENILRDAEYSANYIRFSNFKPLEEYNGDY